MYIFGKNVAKETLENNKKVLKAIVSKDFSDKNIISMLNERHINIEYVSKFDIDKILFINTDRIQMFPIKNKFRIQSRNRECIDLPL